MAVRSKKVEEPCSVTGKGCKWEGYEFYDDDGSYADTDLMCSDCGRWRDWSKDALDTRS